MKVVFAESSPRQQSLTEMFTVTGNQQLHSDLVEIYTVL